MQKVKNLLVVGSPFVIFFLAGALFQSALSYYIKFLLLVGLVIGVNMSGRILSIPSDTTMEVLPVSVYLATKVS